MERIAADVCAHLLTESFSDPQEMALLTDEVWTICGKSGAVHALSDEFTEIKQQNYILFKVRH